MRIDWVSIPYFAGMDAFGQRKLDKGAVRRIYPAGALIFAEDDPCAGLHILVDGMVRIYRVNAGGRLHTLSLLRPVVAFNEVAAIDGGLNPFNATAVTATEVMVISHTHLLDAMSSESVMLNNTIQALARLNREYIERLEDMTFRTIPSRLAKLFLHQAAYADQIAETPSQLTQEEIAAILGTTREVVGRAMRQLMNAGLLKKRGRGVFIADREGLQALADTNCIPEKLISPS
ncbi:MAG: Crp/Fnr family transcriptional regulator [Anaerolineae bacterium]|nr:Crp/Fnr family transcriptional regulator [Anaerolineae bacterium]